jgi:hypothetical protein
VEVMEAGGIREIPCDHTNVFEICTTISKVSVVVLKEFCVYCSEFETLLYS